MASLTNCLHTVRILRLAIPVRVVAVPVSSSLMVPIPLPAIQVQAVVVAGSSVKSWSNWFCDGTGRQASCAGAR